MRIIENCPSDTCYVRRALFQRDEGTSLLEGDNGGGILVVGSEVEEAGSAYTPGEFESGVGVINRPGVDGINPSVIKVVSFLEKGSPFREVKFPGVPARKAKGVGTLFGALPNRKMISLS